MLDIQPSHPPTDEKPTSHERKEDDMSKYLEKITPERIQKRIDELSRCTDDERLIGEGGSRLTLGEGERKARVLITEWMHEAGMETQEWAGGIVGIYWSEDHTNADQAVSTGGHFDTVPAAGRYDGQYSIASAIEAVYQMNLQGIRPKRPIVVFAFTGEEQGLMLGSRSCATGLTDAELDAPCHSGQTARTLLTEYGFDPESVKRPFLDELKEKYGLTLTDWLEIHSGSGKEQASASEQVHIVETITGSDKREIAIGSPSMTRVSIDPSTSAAFRITFKGVSAHAATLPMNEYFISIADGVDMPRKDTLYPLLYQLQALLNDNSLRWHLVSITSPGQAMNKVNGETDALLVVENYHDNAGYIARQMQVFQVFGDRLFSHLGEGKFSSVKVEGEHIPSEVYFQKEQYSLIYSAQQTIFLVNGIASQVSQLYPGFTATTGTVSYEGEVLKIGLDVRSTTREATDFFMAFFAVSMLAGYATAEEDSIMINTLGECRQAHTLDQMLKLIPMSCFFSKDPTTNPTFYVTSPSLPGSTPPTILPNAPQEELHRLATERGISVGKAESKPGQDTMNMAKRIPNTAFAFIRAGRENDGACHVPEESMTHDDMKAGAHLHGAWLYQKAMVQ